MSQFRTIRISLICIMLLLLSGCWSSIDIQNQHYVSSLGVDYDGETFYLYAQIVRFENVARTEGQGAGAPVNTYVGIGKGSTVNTAVANLYNTAQVRIDWGHTNAVVVSARAMMALGKDIADYVYRFPENRYNTWLYITEESIEEIFLTNSFYDRTSLFSILHMPKNAHSQNSSIPPIQMFKYISIMNEPDRITAIPVVSVNKEQWKTNEGPLPLLTVDSGYFEAYNGVKKIIPKEMLKGIRWIDPRMNRTMLIISDSKKKYGVVTIDDSKVKIKAKLVNGEVKFDIKAKYKGGLHEYIDEVGYYKMIELAKKAIEKEVRTTYEIGVNEQLDFMDLMHAFRMKNPDAWRKMTNTGQKFILDKQSIENIDIEIHIPFNGKYKRIK